MIQNESVFENMKVYFEVNDVKAKRLSYKKSKKNINLTFEIWFFWIFRRHRIITRSSSMHESRSKQIYNNFINIFLLIGYFVIFLYH